jgi:hypothetical protein
VYQAACDGESDNDGAAFLLVCERTLPSFDTTKSLKTMLLTAKGLERFNRIRSRGRHVFATMMQVGNLLMVFTVLAPRRFGHYTAVIAPILQLPGFILIVAAVRVQMVRILVTTYDFWFLTMSNAFFCAGFAVLLGDVRILSMVVGCLIVQVSICADAQVGNARQLLVSSIINTVAHSILLLAVLFRVVESSSKQITLFGYFSDDGAMSARDVLMNTQFSMIMLFAKLVYRNWRIVRERAREGRQVTLRSVLIPQTRKCVTYQCVLKLASPESAAGLATLDPRSRGSVMGTHPVSPNGVVQLQCVRIREVFHVRDTVVPISRGGFMQLLLSHGNGQHVVQNKRTVCLWTLYLMGLCGCLIIPVLSDPMGWLNLKWPAFCLEAASLICSSGFCGVFFAFYNRRLLRRLVFTFDFFFLSSKITIACCCLSYVVGWDERALSVACFWVWIHWALTLDALTPTAAHALAFRRLYLLTTIVVMFVMQILIGVEIFFRHPEQIVDVYMLKTTVAGHYVDVRMAPFFFARVWSIFLWSGRLLWRALTRQSEDERLMIEGQVEFHFHWRKRLASRHVPPVAAGLHAPGLLRVPRNRIHPRISQPTP